MHTFPMKFVLIIAAILCELLATFNTPARPNLMALGLALWMIAGIVP